MLNYIEEYKKKKKLNLNYITLNLIYGLECGEGWNSLINELLEELNNKKYTNNEKIEVIQIKEKFGELRFYCNNINREGLDLIAKFEIKSQKICENCGKESKIFNKTGWLYNRCEDCKNGNVY